MTTHNFLSSSAGIAAGAGQQAPIPPP